jgi:hypothetical protein
VSQTAQGHELHHSLNILEQRGGQGRSLYLAPGESGDGLHHGRSRGLQGSMESASRGALHVVKVGTEDCSIDHDELGGLLRSLVDNCGWGRGGNFAHTLHCAHMSC